MIRSSDSLASFAPAFVKAQAAMPNVLKEATGQVGQQRTKYADLTGLITAVRPVLEEHNLSFFQGCSDGNQVVTVTTRIMHSSGEWLEDSLTCPTGRNDAQAIGSAITYIKRYALAAALGIATEDDDGKAASEPRQQAPARGARAAAKPKSPDEKAMSRMHALFNEAGMLQRPERLDFTSSTLGHPVGSSKELNADEVARVIKALEVEIEHQPADGERVPS